jgi:TPR repeat protein
VDQDPVKAYEWYRRAAEGGLAEARFNVGICLLHGLGVKEDSKAAVEWLQKAADQGFQPAVKALADLNAQLSGL